MEFLSSSKEMRQTSTSSLKQSLWSGSGAMAGGMLMGPVGGLVGGIAGSLVGYVNSPNYDGALIHLSKLDEQSKKELLKSVIQVLMVAGAQLQVYDTNTVFRDALFSYASQPAVRDGLWNACLEKLPN